MFSQSNVPFTMAQEPHRTHFNLEHYIFMLICIVQSFHGSLVFSSTTLWYIGQMYGMTASNEF